MADLASAKHIACTALTPTVARDDKCCMLTALMSCITGESEGQWLCCAGNTNAASTDLKKPYKDAEDICESFESSSLNSGLPSQPGQDSSNRTSFSSSICMSIGRESPVENAQSLDAYGPAEQMSLSPPSQAYVSEWRSQLPKSDASPAYTNLSHHQLPLLSPTKAARKVSVLPSYS